ncbi:unnamed protein product [Haemonchus placei]|uniref:Uncharacterized protein n=1 Tax=Haemonchus placei TaxID=6290 RepID=A0A0N4VWE2_HAEPC|nr:unnamed protein product [Haemonchus placei]
MYITHVLSHIRCQFHILSYKRAERWRGAADFSRFLLCKNIYLE